MERLLSRPLRLQPRAMTGRGWDIIIAGGGLAGGLIALALRQHRPDIRVLILESGARLGGNHRWSWFASDLAQGGEALLAPIPQVRWDAGYDVRFPRHARTLRTAYRSIASPDFDAALRTALPADAIRTGTQVAGLDAAGVTLAEGERIEAGAVIDCRGQAPAPQLTGGWQLFYGRHLRTSRPHGVERPVIMDATAAQIGGYRFVYLLPLTADEIFVEDTYYADSPLLDRAALSARIDAYCAARGWQGAMLGEETGVLPVITGGDVAAFRASQTVPGVGLAGARGGLTHPLTSYSLPLAVGTALAIAHAPDLSGPTLSLVLEGLASRHWRETRFYRMLGRMLFGTSEPEERYRIFERFYCLPEALIERFHAGATTGVDRVRILCGRPPVPLGNALKALLGRGEPLVREGAA